MAPVDLAFRRLGEGPPVLVLHGLLGQGRNWQAIAKRLQNRLSLFLVDMRNHGASPWAATMGYAEMAADLAALIEREGLGRAALVGHSMGGKAAMALALTRPELVTRLCVVDIAPVAYAHRQEFEGYIRAMLAIDPAKLERRSELEKALARAAEDPAIRAFLAANAEPRHGRLEWAANLRVLLETLPEITGFPAELLEGRYEGPALFLRGGRSSYIADADRPAIERMFPKAEIGTIPDAGHWVHAEKPMPVIEALGRFLAGS